MSRRGFLILLPAGVLLAADLPTADRFRGRLVVGPAPYLELPGGKRLPLTGDDDVMGVLRDDRLSGAEFEAVGALDSGTIRINPIHTAPVYAYKDGKRLRVTYWCDVCAIRTYTPGICWCCREETVLELRDPEAPEKK